VNSHRVTFYSVIAYALSLAAERGMTSSSNPW
jgi:hypothetical protein